MMSGAIHLFGKVEDMMTGENLRNVYGFNISMENGIYRKYATFCDDLGLYHLTY